MKGLCNLSGGFNTDDLILKELSYNSGYVTGTTSRDYTFTLSKPLDLKALIGSFGVGNSGAYSSANQTLKLYANNVLIGTSTGSREARGMYYHKFNINLSKIISNVKTIKISYSSSDNETNMIYTAYISGISSGGD